MGGFRRGVFFLLVLGLLTSGCVGSTPALVVKPNPVESVDARLIDANTTLGFNVFSGLYKSNPEQNVFISPASIAMALAMTYNGADGTTKEAMARTLGLQEMSLDEVNKANADLNTILANPDPKIKLAIANSLWAREGIEFKPEFLERNKNHFEAEVKVLDFIDPGSPGIINKWVKENTGNKIDKIVEDIDPNSILFLINAIYFKGSWADEFDPAKTKDGLFYLADGTQKKHPMMTRTGQYDYFCEDDCQAVRIPYGNDRLAMYVLLPTGNSNLAELCGHLNTGDWEKRMGLFSRTALRLVLPKFTFEYEASLKDTLKALGMAVAFDANNANFGNMCPVSPDANVYIGDVKHKTFIDVNEEGTEAAAVTSVNMECGAATPPQVYEMIVDHPFFFAIRDDQTGAILFMGSVLEP